MRHYLVLAEVHRQQRAGGDGEAPGVNVMKRFFFLFDSPENKIEGLSLVSIFCLV
jgi:hypothetical protein